MVDILPPIGGILLLVGLCSLLWFSCLCPIIKSLKQPKNRPSLSPLSSLKVGDLFEIPDDEYYLWEVLHFGMQGVFVQSVDTGRTEWLKYDLEVEKFYIINNQIYD